MQAQEVKTIIEQGLPGSEATVRGEGDHFEAEIVSDAFVDKSAVARQQLVYGTLGDLISSNRIHALSMRTYTPDEWRQQQKLRVQAE